MDVYEQRIGSYVVRLNREERKKLYQIIGGKKQFPEDELYWLIWHWLKADGIVKFGGAKSKRRSVSYRERTQ